MKLNVYRIKFKFSKKATKVETIAQATLFDIYLVKVKSITYDFMFQFSKYIRKI